MQARIALGLFSIALATAGCGDDNTRGPLPYTPGQKTLLGGTECTKLDDECIDALEQCDEDSAADVLLDEDGNFASVICYPTTGVVIETIEGPVEDVGNNAVLVIDDQVDGVDVEGDVTIDGNNVTLIGHGPDTSVIGGDLNVDKNNSAVRGVRVEGDVAITKNNGSLVDCVIEGDLLIVGNNVSIGLCEIWGKLTIEGNNAVLVGNLFAQAPKVIGQNLVCTDNVLFTDANDDGQVAGDEHGDALDCTNRQVVDADTGTDTDTEPKK